MPRVRVGVPAADREAQPGVGDAAHVGVEAARIELVVVPDRRLLGQARGVAFVKRWLAGILHGRVNNDHLQYFLDEYIFGSTGAPSASPRPASCCMSCYDPETSDGSRT